MAKTSYRAFIKLNGDRGWWYRNISNPTGFLQNIDRRHGPVAVFFYDNDKTVTGCIGYWRRGEPYGMTRVK